MQNSEKRKAKEIIGTPIKEYKLPLIERVAYYRPVLIWCFWLVVTAMIVAPTIAKNYENFWYYLFLSPVIFFFVMSIIKFIKFWWYVAKCNKKIEETVENEHHYDNYSGAPGTGKTLTAEFLYHEKAKYNWRELQFEYWLIAPKLKDKNYKPTLDEQEIIDAYNYYTTHDGVPCWSSNIPAYSKRFKRFAYDVDGAYLKQEKRAPYRLCSVVDEIGTVATVEMFYGRSSNENGATDMTDNFKFCRHFNLWSIVGCEQDYNNIYIDCKRVASENRVYTGKKWVLKPRFLCWLYNKLKIHFIRKMSYSEAKVFSKFMQKLNQFKNCCGFFRFTYKIKENTETKSSNGVSITVQSLEEKDVVYIPRANEIKYRTRAFREAYKAKDKPLDLEVWESLYMTTERARSMLKSENLRKKEDKPSKSEKSSSEVLQF